MCKCASGLACKQFGAIRAMPFMAVGLGWDAVHSELCTEEQAYWLTGVWNFG